MSGRSRWAALGAAVAGTFGAGAVHVVEIAAAAAAADLAPADDQRVAVTIG